MKLKSTHSLSLNSSLTDVLDLELFGDRGFCPQTLKLNSIYGFHKMNVPSGVIFSLMSAFLASLGTWVALSSYQTNMREKLFSERKQLFLAEENIKVLRSDYDHMKRTVDAMFNKLDERCDSLDRSHHETQATLRLIVERTDRIGQSLKT